MKTLTVKAYQNMNMEFCFVVVCAIQLDLQLAAYANLRFPNTIWYYAWVNIVLSVAILAFYIFVIYYAMRMFSQVLKIESQPSDPKSKVGKWYFLKDDINPKLKGRRRYFQFFLMIKETILGFVIIFSITDAPFQILPLVAMSITTLQFLISYRPFKEKRLNTISIIEEFVFLIVFVMMLWIH